MNKIYLTAPLAALALFIGLFVWSQSGVKQREAEKKQAAVAAHTAKLAAEKTARDAAIAEAIVINEQRKKERAEREARDTAERAARDAAYRDQERLKRDLERLKREIAVETEIVNRLQIDHDASLSEKTFLEKFVPNAAAQVAELERVLRQIATAEAARVKAAAEAAAAKSKS